MITVPVGNIVILYVIFRNFRIVNRILIRIVRLSDILWKDNSWLYNLMIFYV